MRESLWAGAVTGAFWVSLGLLDAAGLVAVERRWWWLSGGAILLATALSVCLFSWTVLAERLGAHRHLVPLLLHGWLLCAMVVLAPEARLMTLVTYQVLLLLYAGRLGFAQVFSVGCAVTAAYQVALYVLVERGRLEGLSFELAVSVFFLGSQVLAGLVFVQLKQVEDERRELGRRLAGMALTDSLTELPNRRYFEDVATRELERCKRSGDSFAVAMIDVDGFKQVNDEFGHAAGDQLLIDVARAIGRGTRESDFVARFGGDEFAVLLPAVDAAIAVAVAERLRCEVASVIAEVSAAGRAVGVTLSVGVALAEGAPEAGAEREATVRSVLGRADDALYRAKRAGKNRVALALAGEPALAASA